LTSIYSISEETKKVENKRSYESDHYILLQ